MLLPQKQMMILEFLAAINGAAQLYSADGQFLGVVSSNQHDPDSISNPYGLHGSDWGVHSIRNRHGIYGGFYGVYSPYNDYCINPPIVIYQGQPVLVVTKNRYAITNGLPGIDPDLLLEVYAQLDTVPHAYNYYDDIQWQLDMQAQAVTQMFRTY